MSSERWTPKCLWLGTCFRIIPLKVRLGFDLILLFENNMISVFNGLNSIPHFSAQLFSKLRSLFKVCSKSLQFLNVWRRATSSAKSEILDCMPLSMSFKKICGEASYQNKHLTLAERGRNRHFKNKWWWWWWFQVYQLICVTLENLCSISDYPHHITTKREVPKCC